MNEGNCKAASDRQLADEAEQWSSGTLRPDRWKDTHEAVPMHASSTPISIRVPTQMLTVLKAFAEREGVGYQILVKRWLDDRIRAERSKLSESADADQEHLALASTESGPPVAE